MLNVHDELGSLYYKYRTPNLSDNVVDILKLGFLLEGCGLLLCRPNVSVELEVTKESFWDEISIRASLEYETTSHFSGSEW